MVTDCRVDSRGIKIRRRWVVDTQESSATYHVVDLHIPVPPGKADDAAKIVDTLKTFIADHSHLVARVIPPDAIYSLMGEIDF